MNMQIMQLPSGKEVSEEQLQQIAELISISFALDLFDPSNYVCGTFSFSDRTSPEGLRIYVDSSQNVIKRIYGYSNTIKDENWEQRNAKVYDTICKLQSILNLD